MFKNNHTSTTYYNTYIKASRHHFQKQNKNFNMKTKVLVCIHNFKIPM